VTGGRLAGAAHNRLAPLAGGVLGGSLPRAAVMGVGAIGTAWSADHAEQIFFRLQ